MERYIVAFDQGTTSCKAVLFDARGGIVGMAQKEFTQYFPRSGWVEHDPMEIWRSQCEVFAQVLKTCELEPSQIEAVGITNQRETTVIWDRTTGVPVCNAIVWQDRRTAPVCEFLHAQGLAEYIRQNTGLVIDAYFSATKIKWILDNVDGALDRAKRGDLLFGTIDTWLIWNMTGGAVHATDYSNASRTMLYNIRDRQWDSTILDILEIPGAILPEVRDSSGDFGHFQFDGASIAIRGVAGDQQAALFGQTCFDDGEAKNTYGTGCFLLMNTGERFHLSRSGLLTTIAWGLSGKICYALEGSVFIAGAAVQWLRDELKIIHSCSMSEELVIEAGDSEEVIVVPAFAGLGAPHWDMYARGAIFGLTRDTGRAHIVKATLESLAYQTRDVLDVMVNDTGLGLKKLKVDGGASANDFLMQFQADILHVEVERPKVIESTALGAAFLAGLASGIWTLEDIRALRGIDRTFVPKMDDEKRERLYARWQKALKRTMNWVEQ